MRKTQENGTLLAERHLRASRYEALPRNVLSYRLPPSVVITRTRFNVRKARQSLKLMAFQGGASERVVAFSEKYREWMKIG